MSGKARKKARTKAREGEDVAKELREDGSDDDSPVEDGDASRVEASSLPDRSTERPGHHDPRRRAKLYAAVAAGVSILAAALRAATMSGPGDTP